MLLGKTLPSLLQLQNFGNSTLKCSTSLWHVRPTQFVSCWTVVKWWSPSLHKNDLLRLVSSEALNRIVCGRYHYHICFESYHLKSLNTDSGNYSETWGFWSKCREAFPDRPGKLCLRSIAYDIYRVFLIQWKQCTI